jgi:hypothetical protein
MPDPTTALAAAPTTTFRGHPACACLAEWLRPFEAELKARGLIENTIDVLQLIGLAEASELVHSTGGAADIRQIHWRVSFVARQMGAVAWPRVTGSFADNQHTHLVLVGCPHLHQQARDQITAAFQGGDGLLGDVPDDPRLAAALVPGRTWRQGIAWHRRQERLRKLKTVLIPRALARLEKLRAEKKALES